MPHTLNTLKLACRRQLTDTAINQSVHADKTQRSPKSPTCRPITIFRARKESSSAKNICMKANATWIQCTKTRLEGGVKFSN